MILNGTKYKTVLLDTNVIGEFLVTENTTDEIAEHKRDSFKTFINQFILEDKYAFLISCYSIIELLPYQDIYGKFKEMFGIIPFFFVFTDKQLVEEELRFFKQGEIMKLGEHSNKILYSISFIKDNLDSFLEEFIKGIWEHDSGKIKEDLADEAKYWNSQRNNFNKEIKKTYYYRLKEYMTVKSIVEKYVGEVGIDNFDLRYFAGVRLMQFTQYKKVHHTKKQITMNDVIDVKICGIVPYVDAVITENQQASFFEESKAIIRVMKNIEILTLKNIRQSTKS